MNIITQKQIINLNDEELTVLLRRLLYLEKNKYNLLNCSINVPEEINAPDGGEDGRIETSDKKESSWILSNFCIFQCKATKMSADGCKKEMLKSDLKSLKPQIDKALKKNASYILIASKDKLAKQGIESRKIKIREALKDVKIEEGLSLKEANDYSESIKVDVYDSSLIASWVNEHFPAILYVQECNGMTRPQGLLDWVGLKSYSQNQNEFYSNEKLNNIISIIQKELINGKNLRIEGSSGIGKTRLICEALAPFIISDDDELDETLNNAIVYSDIGDGSIDLLNFVKSHNKLNMILVLDNCSPKTHEDFINECNRTGSNITLVTIDYEKANTPLLNDFDIIELKDEYYESVTKDVLYSKYKQVLSDSDINYLIKFSEGNTKMAIDFAEASIQEIELNHTLNEKLIEKLISGRDKITENEFDILKILSVFKAFEFPDGSYYTIDKNHYNQLMESINFVSEYFEIDTKLIRKTITKFIDKRSIERRGNFIMLRPTPLALKLSLLFWENFPRENYTDFIEKIPPQMRKEVTFQLERVGNIEEAKEIVTNIWGLDGNFSTAEMLNSDSGSLLFRSIVNVNPIETVKVLKRNYLDKSTEDLRKVLDGRQNLVWSLEKLCFRKETFNDASKILMSFAVAEIETYYSNNSTSYFKQLFHVYLAGTEVDYNNRLETLYWAIGKNSSEFDIMTLKACESALSGMEINARMIGAENQGSKLPLKDYQPKNLSEIHEYADNILIVLKKLYNNYEENINRIIRSSIYFFSESNYDFNELRYFFENMIKAPKSRHELRKTLMILKSFKIQYQSQNEVADEYISKTEPQTIEEEIKDKVSNPQYIHSKDIEIDITKENCEAFAEKIYKEGIELNIYLKNLFVGEQHQTYNFGKKYGELKGFEESFLDEILIFLIDIRESDNWNISFLQGYLSEFSFEIRKSVFYKFLCKKSNLSFHLFRGINPNLNDALKLIELININNVKYLSTAGYELSLLNIGEFISFLDNLNPLLENKSPILDLIHNYIRSHPQESTMQRFAIFEWLEKLMKKHNLVENVYNNNQRFDYDWQKTMELMLLTKPIYVSLISEQIISYYKSNFRSLISDHSITKVAILTLETNFELAWNNYSQLIFETPHYLLFSKIFDLGFSSNRNTHPFFSDKERNKKILNWCKLHPEIAKRIIRYTPLFSDSGEWFDFTFKMIKEFGNREDFLSELSSNFFSMTTVGSKVPYLESRKKLLEKLKPLNISELTNWVEEQIEYFNKQIKIEKITDEQEGLR